MNENYELLKLLIEGSQEALDEYLEHVYPADFLHLIHDGQFEDHMVTMFFNRLSIELIAQIIDEEEEYDKYNLFIKIPENMQRAVLDAMSSDELADMIGNIDNQEQVEDVLSSLTDENKEEVTQLLLYRPDSAGGIMATEFINLYDNKTVVKVLQYLQEIKEEVESQYALYVTDRNNILKGVCTLSDIATSTFDTTITDIMNPNVISVHFDDDQEDVSKVFDKYNLPVVPVVDDNNQILGIITFDDIIEVIHQEATEDIHQLAGIDADETVDSSISETVKSRLPWLVVNMFAALISSSIVSGFSNTISQVVALAAIMPMVTAMGGNVGSQTYTFIIRSIAMGEIDETNQKEVFRKEIIAATINSVLLSIIAFLVGSIIGRDVHLGILMAVAVICVIVFSSMIGYLVPILLTKLKIDPAIATSAFVATLTDSFGFFVFLGLATLFMEMLI